VSELSETDRTEAMYRQTHAEARTLLSPYILVFGEVKAEGQTTSLV
jgi:hypothetical protein